ncbi:MAG: Zn-ribbon domain-containing OB-fold protein [Thermodesulfobacteriota bacterium]|nr:Zn-ribbon domain-containing OB-fold protein [Thermodesulfobacteriota bacterium]
MKSEENVVKAYYKLEAEFNYSYGKISRFFQELMENKKIMGTRCTKCGVVFCPPTSDCPKCWVPTEWVEVGPEGMLLHYTIINLPVLWMDKEVPYTLGLIKLDGSDTGLMHFVDETDKTKLKRGLRVKAIFAEERKGYITDIDQFMVVS